MKSAVQVWDVACERQEEIRGPQAADVFEPDVSLLAIQGPQADELAARVFGDAVRSIRFFRYKRLSLGGVDMVVVRSRYSKQGGFEIYVEGASMASRSGMRFSKRGGISMCAPGAPT